MFILIYLLDGVNIVCIVFSKVLWVAPLEWLRWLLVMIGMALSGTVLLLTFWPAVEDDDKKVSVNTTVENASC